MHARYNMLMSVQVRPGMRTCGVGGGGPVEGELKRVDGTADGDVQELGGGTPAARTESLDGVWFWSKARRIDQRMLR
jgi:hypothetical protein